MQILFPLAACADVNSMGGGSYLVKNFAQYDEKRVTVNGDICATAKGYERLAENNLRKEGRRGMSERQMINTNIRLNLANEDDRRAWTYLRNMDRKQYKSYSRAVVAALNDYFGRH